MGWETMAMAGFSLLNAGNKIQQGKNEANAAVQEGAYQADNMANQTARQTGTLETSFAKSGIALSGGVKNVLQQSLAQGQTDIARTVANYNATSQNDMTSARTAALDTLAGNAGMQSIGSGVAGLADNATNAVWQGSVAQGLWNGTGQDIGSMLDPSPTGPYLPFGS